MSAPWTPEFTWITTDLAVGGAFPVGQARVLAREHGVGAIIDLRSEACDDIEELSVCGVEFLHLPTPDMIGVSQPMLDCGVDFARQCAARGRRLLVHCQHGIGRSATLVLCILVDRGIEPLQALLLAKTARAKVSPSRSQYDAWVDWTLRQRPQVRTPTYHEFGIVAYRSTPRQA